MPRVSSARALRRWAPLCHSVTCHSVTCQVRHFEFDIAHTSLTYRVGDHLEILPRNDPALVKKFLEHYGLGKCLLAVGSTCEIVGVCFCARDTFFPTFQTRRCSFLSS